MAKTKEEKIKEKDQEIAFLNYLKTQHQSRVEVLKRIDDEIAKAKDAKSKIK